VHARLLHRGYPARSSAYVLNQHFSMPPAGCGKRHFHIDNPGVPSSFCWTIALVDEAEVDNVNGNFRIVAGAHLIPGELCARPSSGGVGGSLEADDVLPNRMASRRRCAADCPFPHTR